MDIAAWIEYFSTGTNWVVPVLILWLAPWKLFALWRAARRGQWLTFLLFFVILPVNTFGIIEMFYIFAWSKEHPESAFEREMRVFNKKSENKREKNEDSAPIEPRPVVPLIDKKTVQEELAQFRGLRRPAPEVKTLPNTEGMGKIDLSALTELERIRKIEREEGVREDKKSLTPSVPQERKTVRPDIPIPKPPVPERQNAKGKMQNGTTNSETTVMATTQKEVVPEVEGIAKKLMSGVYVAKKKGEQKVSV